MLFLKSKSGHHQESIYNNNNKPAGSHVAARHVANHTKF